MKRGALFILVSLFLACSSSDDPGSTLPPGGGGGGGGAAGGGGGAAGGGGGGGAGGGGGGGTAQANKPGLIVVQNHRGSIVASAIFSSEAPKDCKMSTFGSCQVQTCPNPGDVTAPLAGAGTLTVTDGTIALTMAPVVDDEYGVDHTGGAYPDGATVSVSGTGKDVPAFSGKSAVMPAALTSDVDLSTVNSTADIALTWTGGGPAGKVVFFTETDDAKTIGQLTCTYEAAAGSGTVPAAAIAAIPTCTADSDTCVWSLAPESNVSFTAGDYAVDLSVRGEGVGGFFGQ